MNKFERSAFEFGSSNTALQMPVEMATEGFALLQAFGTAMLRCQAESIALLSRRMKAQMELPKQFSQCSDLREVGEVQSSFLAKAMRDYTACGQRTAEVWRQPMRQLGKAPWAAPFVEMASAGLPENAAEITKAMSRPFVEGMRQMSSKLEEASDTTWEWWRTDMKGLKPRRNGHDASHTSA